MTAKIETLRARVAKMPLPRAHALLLAEKKACEDRLAEIARIRADVEAAAVGQGLAMFVDGPQRELAPSKETFIKTFGIEVWNRMKRLSEAGQKFVWLQEMRKHG
jgi:hypothetical protein